MEYAEVPSCHPKYHHVTRSHRNITESLVKEMNSKESAAVSDNAETNRKNKYIVFL